MGDFLLAEVLTKEEGRNCSQGDCPFVLPYMQTWVDNETWRAPVRLDIVIEDEPTEAAT